MKYIINDAVVVEGTWDASYISSFVDCEIIVTNGLDVPQNEIDYLKNLSKYKKILVLTDPDEAGETIRRRIHDQVEAIDVVVDKTKCNKNHKHGVAECEKDELIKCLKPFFVNTKNISENITNNFLFMNGINNKEIYHFIGKKFCLGNVNKKVLLTRLNSTKVAQEDLLKAVKEYREYGNQ